MLDACPAMWEDITSDIDSAAVTGDVWQGDTADRDTFIQFMTTIMGAEAPDSAGLNAMADDASTVAAECATQRLALLDGLLQKVPQDALTALAAISAQLASDDEPDPFDFESLTDVPHFTLIESSIQQITGIDMDVPVSITGAGNPEFRVCGDQDCTAILIPYGSTEGIIEEGQYLQLRLTSDAYEALTSATVTVGTASDEWDVTTGLPGGGSSMEKVVFITSITYKNLDGVAGADAKCQARAGAGGLAGDYKAWVATGSSDSPASRFAHSTVPYVLPDGTKIADDWADLTDGSLDAPIDITENGVSDYSKDHMYSNVRTDGTHHGTSNGDHCEDWTSESSSRNGHVGQIDVDGDWTDNASKQCSFVFSLYCFEQ